jgi:hypothetical protein
MVEANCPDGYCMHKGVVSPGADTIVCLPHKLIVGWIKAPQSVPEELDVIVQ